MDQKELDDYLKLEFEVASGNRFNYKNAWEKLVVKFNGDHKAAFKFICGLAIAGFQSSDPVARYIENGKVIEQKAGFKFDKNTRDQEAMTLRRCIAYCAPAIRIWLSNHPNQKTILSKQSSGPNNVLFIGAEYCVKTVAEKNILISALEKNLAARLNNKTDIQSFLDKTSLLCDYSISNK